MTKQDTTTRQCKKCKEILPLEEFELSHKLHNKSWRRRVCKKCFLQSQVLHYVSVRNKNEKELDYSTIDMEKKKKCSSCKQELFLPEFCKNISSKDGFAHICKSCAKVGHKKWYDENKPYAIARVKEWGNKNPVLVKRAKSKYAASNPDRIRQSQRDFYQNHLEEERERNRKKNNARAKAIRNLRYRAKEKGLPFLWNVTHHEYALCYWNFACACCGTQNGLWHTIAFDHWIPIASIDCHGSVPTNMIPLCHPKKDAPVGTPGCNLSKGAKDPMVWLTEKFGARKAKAKLKEITIFFEAAKVFAENLACKPL